MASVSAVSAQEVPQRRAFTAQPVSPAPSMPAVKVVGDVVEEIVLPMHKAKVLTLSRAITRAVIGDPSVMDVEQDPETPNKIILRPRAVGLTNVFFMDNKGDVIRHAEVRVVFDNQGIKSALGKLLPGETINVTAFRNTVFLTGAVSSPVAVQNAVSIAGQFVAEAANVVNMMTVIAGQQVILQVRVAEMDRTVRKNLAVDATFSKRFGNLGGRGFDAAGVAPASIFADTSFVTGTLFTGTNILGNATFEALERQSLAKTLAEPTLTALSGETATFLSGGEFAIPVGKDENDNKIFKMSEFGIRLEFTPTVLDKGRIRLVIATEISAIGETINTFASLTQKQTTTTIEMPSGGTLMISGLLQDDMTDTINGVPFLKDVPILGALFRSTGFTQNRTELVITVSAYLVKPINNARDASLPTDGFEEATDIDLYIWGRLHRQYSDSEETFWDNPLKGPFGYIMK
jgi:pilus assembly protein CpaC